MLCDLELLVVTVLQAQDKVADVMTKGRIYSARVDTPVDDGMPPSLLVHCPTTCSSLMLANFVSQCGLWVSRI